MFQLEQDEYEREKINWERKDFNMNSQGTIDLIERKPNGILTILDEESVFPKATDETFLHKLNEKHQHNPSYEKPRFAGAPTFGIKHYAGKVEYNVTKWLEKNKDPLQNDLETLMRESRNPFVGNLFLEDPNRGKKSAQLLTVGYQYKEQLTDLMTTLNRTQPHFVRCILPNHGQRPNKLESSVILE